MVWKRRQEKYRTVDMRASTTASRITASRICSRGVGFSDLILMDGVGAAARAVPVPVCASKFASLTTRDSSGWRGALPEGHQSSISKAPHLAAASAACKNCSSPLGGEDLLHLPEGQ